MYNVPLQWPAVSSWELFQRVADGWPRRNRRWRSSMECFARQLWMISTSPCPHISMFWCADHPARREIFGTVAPEPGGV